MKKTVAILALLVPSIAHAAYIENRSQWEGLGQGGKNGYAMGAYDAAHLDLVTDTKSDTALKHGRRSCVVQMRIESGMMSKLIDEGYASDPAAFSVAPSVLLLRQLSKVCASYIQAEQARVGL